MSFGIGYLDDETDSADSSQRAVPVPSLLKKGVGHAFLDDDEDGIVFGNGDGRRNGRASSGDAERPSVMARSLVSSNMINMMAFQMDQNVREGRYRTEFQQVARLGRGGFGSVFLVRNKLDRGLYAVKKIRFRRCRRDGKLGNKLMREILAMNELNHPNIVRYHGSWVEDDVSPHGTPNVSSDYPVKLYELDDDDESGDGDEKCGDKDEDGEDEEGEEGDEYGLDDQEDSEAGIVNADDSDDEEKSDLDGSTTSVSCDTSVSAGNAFEMDRSKSKSKKQSKKKKKQKKPSPKKSWTYGTLYIQMQYYKETLDNWLDSPARKNHVCPHVSRDIFMQIVEALHYIHSKHYIHRDLKPANIFLTPREDDDDSAPSPNECMCKVCGAKGCGRGYIVSVGDFGLTTLSQDVKVEPNSPVEVKSQHGEGDGHKLLSEKPAGYTLSPVRVPIPDPSHDRDGIAEAIAQSMPRLFAPFASSRDAATGGLRSRSRSNSRPNSQFQCSHTTGVGSMTYASPEQMTGRFYDEKTDIFSLGIVCYQLFSPPFSTRMQRAEEFKSIRSGCIPSSFVKNYPEVAAFIKSCLSPEPEDRPSTSEILAMPIWEPAPCMCVKGSSYSVSIPRSTFLHMQNEISRLQKELEMVKEQLAKATGGHPSAESHQPQSSTSSRHSPKLNPVFCTPRRPPFSARPYKSEQHSSPLTFSEKPPLVFGVAP